VSDQWISLETIIGEGDGTDSRNRVVYFYVDDNKLNMIEGCDRWFGAALNADEVDELINWLIKARQGLS
jgi:hypothetical protein